MEIQNCSQKKILLSKKENLNVIIFRPPTIIGEGRLGILSVVFDFIKDNKKTFFGWKWKKQISICLRR